MVEIERAEPGQDLRLTLDAAIQERTEAVLAEVGKTYTPAGATALVMDPRSGAILALANWPRVDANNVSGAPAYARQNRAIAASYEPGSTFKAFTVAGALEEKLIEPDTQLRPAAADPGGRPHDRGGPRARRRHAHRGRHPGPVLERRLGDDRAEAGRRAVRPLGPPLRLRQPRPGSTCPGSSRASSCAPSEYSGSSMGNMPIGQGIAVTPIQMATAYTAIANGGVLREPYVVAGARRPPRRVLSEHNARRVSKMLEGVLAAGGTAEEASVDGYTLAGKTGTAEKAENGGYSKTNFVASFIGYAPARDPRLLVAVMVDEPRGSIYGGDGGRPGLRADRGVRPALPQDPAGVTEPGERQQRGQILQSRMAPVLECKI